MVETIIFAIIDFIKLLIPIAIISFIALKLGVPLREKLSEKYDLSWVKSALLINLVFVFTLIFLTYIYFIIIGTLATEFFEPTMDYTSFETLIMIGIAVIRIAVASIILALALLFFEFVCSITISMQKGKSSNLVKEIIGVIITSAVFLFLFLFFFSFTAIGLFVYIFYGSATNLPLLSLIISL